MAAKAARTPGRGAGEAPAPLRHAATAAGTGGSSASSRSATRVARARATRERIVPTGQPCGLGRCLVGQSRQLGEDERLTALGGQRVQQVEQGHALVEAGQAARLGPLGPGRPVVDVGRPRPGGGVPQAVDERAACDGQQPGARRRAPLEPVQAAERPQERVLCEVVGQLAVGGEVRDVADDVGTQGTHEAVDGVGIAGAGGEGPGGGRVVGRRRRTGLVRRHVSRVALPGRQGEDRSDHLMSFSGGPGPLRRGGTHASVSGSTPGVGCAVAEVPGREWERVVRRARPVPEAPGTD